MQRHEDRQSSGEMTADTGIGWPLGPLEMRVLHILWSCGPATVRDVLTQIAPTHQVAYTTVMTVLTRLAEKGLVHRELVGKGYVYRPAYSEQEFAGAVSQRMLQSLVAEFGDIAVAQFAAQLDRVDPCWLDRLRTALEEESSR